MTPEGALTFLFAIFVFSITPGPGVMAILARALVQGSRACIGLALGMSVSDAVYLVLACFGLAALAEHWGEFFVVIRWVGAAYLLYLGWRMWRSPVDLDEAPDASRRRGSGYLAGFGQGFLISATNPKVILFYIAFLPTFMDLTTLAAGDIALAVVLTIIGLMAGLMLIAHFAATARRLFRSPASVRRLNRTAGSLMVAAAGYLAARN